jgi:hydroxypyruvate isomerase
MRDPKAPGRGDSQDELAADNLAFAAAVVAPIGGTVLLEALADGENGACPLTAPSQIVSVIRRVRTACGTVNIAMLADFYHLTRNGFSWELVIEEYFAQAGHVQIADAPGRQLPRAARAENRIST